MITIDDFIKVELKVGTIISAEDIDGSDKLLKLKVDFGPKVTEQIDASENTTEKPVGEEDEVIAKEVIPSGVEGSINTESLDSDLNDSESMLGNQSIVTENEIASDEALRNDIRQVLSGIKSWYKPEDLIGKQFVFCTNLQPRKMMGMESQAMIMAAEGEEKPIPLTVGTPVPNGAKIR